jgi:hypothetical protein
MSVKTQKDWTAMSRLYVSWTTATHRRRARMRALVMQVAKWTLVKWMVARMAPDLRQMQVHLSQMVARPAQARVMRVHNPEL